MGYLVLGQPQNDNPLPVAEQRGVLDLTLRSDRSRSQGQGGARCVRLSLVVHSLLLSHTLWSALEWCSSRPPFEEPRWGSHPLFIRLSSRCPMQRYCVLGSSLCRSERPPWYGTPSRPPSAPMRGRPIHRAPQQGAEPLAERPSMGQPQRGAETITKRPSVGS